MADFLRDQSAAFDGVGDLAAESFEDRFVLVQEEARSGVQQQQPSQAALVPQGEQVVEPGLLEPQFGILPSGNRPQKVLGGAVPRVCPGPELAMHRRLTGGHHQRPPQLESAADLGGDKLQALLEVQNPDRLLHQAPAEIGIDPGALREIPGHPGGQRDPDQKGGQRQRDLQERSERAELQLRPAREQLHAEQIQRGHQAQGHREDHTPADQQSQKVVPVDEPDQARRGPQRSDRG
ncbi:MAG: hypothetical protein HY013_09515 [Candidatus Solibacter usitatus]|nr:hypothetical protein [Candidatus Solibacter usitatus]